MKSFAIRFKNRLSLVQSDPLYFWTLIVIAVIGIALRIYFIEDFTFDRFMDRDLYRALHPDGFFWTGGSDLFGGQKTPGGFLSLYLKVLYSMSAGQIDFIYLVHALLQLTGTAYLAVQVGRYFSLRAGWLLFVLLIANYVAFEQYVAFWSPTIAIPFVYFAYGFVLKLTQGKKDFYLLLTTFFMVCASQVNIANLVLFPILILAILTSKIRIRKSYVVLSFLIAIVLYGPFIIQAFQSPESSLIALRWNSELTLKSLVGTTFEILANLAGIIFPYNGNQGVQWNYRSLLYDFGTLRILFPLLTILPTLISLIWLKKTYKEYSKDKKPGLGLLLIILFLVLIAFLITIPLVPTDTGSILRHFIWAQPLVLMLMALCLSNFWTNLKGLNRKSLLWTFSVLLAASSAAQFLFFIKSQDEQPNFDRYFFKKEVVDFARNDFHLTDAQIKKNVGLISQDDYVKFPNRYYINTVREDDGTGLMSLLEGQNLKDRVLSPGSDECVMVIQDEDDPERKTQRFSGSSLNEFLRQVQGAPAFEMKKILFGDKGVYFSYEKINGNCINFFENYFYIDEKLELKNALAGKKDGEVVSRVNPETGSQEFLFSDNSFSTRHYFKVDIKVGDSLEGRIFQDTLEHRGEEEQTYFQLFNLQLDSKLILKDLKNGRLTVIPLIEKRNVSPNLVPTSYHFNKPLPTPGDYEVSLQIHPLQKESKTIQLAEKMSIKPAPKELKRKAIE